MVTSALFPYLPLCVVNLFIFFIQLPLRLLLLVQPLYGKLVLGSFFDDRSCLAWTTTFLGGGGVAEEVRNFVEAAKAPSVLNGVEAGRLVGEIWRGEGYVEPRY